MTLIKFLTASLMIYSAGVMAQLNPVDPQKPVEKKMANFKKDIDAPRVGKMRLEYVYDEDSEPVSTPGSLKIFVKCDWRKKEILLEDVRGCDLKSYRYAKEEFILYFEMIFPVVDAGSIAHCEKREDRQFDLKKYCDDLWKKETQNKKKKPAKK